MIREASTPSSTLSSPSTIKHHRPFQTPFLVHFSPGPTSRPTFLQVILSPLHRSRLVLIPHHYRSSMARHSTAPGVCSSGTFLPATVASFPWVLACKGRLPNRRHFCSLVWV